MFKLTECKLNCTCEECKDNSCEWAGRDSDFAISNKKGSLEFYSDDEYLETPIPVQE